MSKLNEFRTVANLETLTWNSLETSSDWKPEDNVWWYNLSFDQETGQGSYLYKMGAGARSNPHEHKGPEEFFILEGDLIDSDGYEYTNALRRWNVRSQQMDFTTRWSQQLSDPGYVAPFDSPQATAGAYRWPWMLPFAQPEEGAAQRQERAFKALTNWNKPAHFFFGDQDQIFTVDWGRKFSAHVPGSSFDVIEGAGHFVQETGEPLTKLIMQRIGEE